MCSRAFLSQPRNHHSRPTLPFVDGRRSLRPRLPHIHHDWGAEMGDAVTSRLLELHQERRHPEAFAPVRRLSDPRARWAGVRGPKPPEPPLMGILRLTLLAGAVEGGHWGAPSQPPSLYLSDPDQRRQLGAIRETRRGLQACPRRARNRRRRGWTPSAHLPVRVAGIS